MRPLDTGVSTLQYPAKSLSPSFPFLSWPRSWYHIRKCKCTAVLEESQPIACAELLSRVWLFATPLDCSLPDSSAHGIFSGKNARMGCHFLFQRIFPTQGSNLQLLCLLHWQVDSLPEPLGKPSLYCTDQADIVFRQIPSLYEGNLWAPAVTWWPSCDYCPSFSNSRVIHFSL